MKFVKSRGKKTLEKVGNANEKLRETCGGGTMRKTMEQIVLEGQVAKCRSLEELYVLWELMQQMEEDPFGNTCYPELDQRNFHVDGIADPEHYDGTLYILKETNMRKMIQKGETMPVASDIRADFLSGKSPSGRKDQKKDGYLLERAGKPVSGEHGEERKLVDRETADSGKILYKRTFQK